MLCSAWHLQAAITAGYKVHLKSEMASFEPRGEKVEIRPEHLQGTQWTGSAGKRCSNCGFTTIENFEYCPKCGKHF